MSAIGGNRAVEGCGGSLDGSDGRHRNPTNGLPLYLARTCARSRGGMTPHLSRVATISPMARPFLPSNGSEGVV